MQRELSKSSGVVEDSDSEPCVLGIYHINLNVSNLERSQAFYEMLGFRVIEEFDQAGIPELDQGLGMDYTDTRALFMGLGRNRPETVLDMAEWRQPKSQERQMPGITDIGMPRIALRVRNLDALYKELISKGVEFISEPKELGFLDRSPKFAICKDPDGIFVEFVELPRRKR